jgi:hypothetical protein
VPRADVRRGRTAAEGAKTAIRNCQSQVSDRQLLPDVVRAACSAAPGPEASRFWATSADNQHCVDGDGRSLRQPSRGGSQAGLRPNARPLIGGQHCPAPEGVPHLAGVGTKALEGSLELF